MKTLATKLVKGNIIKQRGIKYRIQSVHSKTEKLISFKAFQFETTISSPSYGGTLHLKAVNTIIECRKSTKFQIF
jgi:hypothetical protein